MPFFEIYLLPISFITAFILIQELQTIKYKFITILLALSLLLQVKLIVNKSAFFKERITILNSILFQLDEAKIDKAVIDFYQTPMQKL